MAVRDFGTWKSIYSAVPFLDVETLRQCAAYAGVHLYFDRPVISSVSERLVMVHNGDDGELETVLKLPYPCDILNADTGEQLAGGAIVLPLKLPITRTLLLRLRPSGTPEN